MRLCPPLIFDDASLDFGEVWEDAAFQHTVRVKNDGAEPLRVQGASCGCTGLKAEPSQFEVPPGGSQDVRLTLDLTQRPTATADPVPFSTAVRLDIATGEGGAKSRRVVGVLHGSVKVAFRTKPVWNLGTFSPVNGPLDRAHEIVVAVPLASLHIELQASPIWALSATADRPPDAGGPFAVHVRSAGSPATPGSIRSELILRGTTADGVALPPKRVIIEAEVAAQDTRVSPAEVYFGGTPVGRTAESRVSVSSWSGAAVQVESVVPSGPELEVAPGDGPNEFRVRQRVTKVGPVTGEVVVTTKTKGGTERVRVAVEVVGVESTRP